MGQSTWGQIKNIKLHIVTDIKVAFQNNICKVWCSVIQLRLKSVEILCFKQLTLTKWPMYQCPNLPVSTVPSFYTTMTSISPPRKWRRLSVLLKSTWKPSGLDFSQKLSKVETLGILSAMLGLPQLQEVVVVLPQPLMLEVLLPLLKRRRKKRRTIPMSLDPMMTWDLDYLTRLSLATCV